MNARKWLGMSVLMVGVLAAQGCALLLVGAVAGGAAAGTVSYFGNELRVVHEASVDRAWNAATAAVNELQFPVNQQKSHKDGTGGLLVAKNAKSQDVIIEIVRQSDRLTEVRVRVGTFDTEQNRAAAQLVYDRMRTKL